MMNLLSNLNAVHKTSVGLVLIHSTSGTILYTNDTYCSLLGRNHDQVLGRTWMHFTHPDDVGYDVYYIREFLGGNMSLSPRIKRYIDINGNSIYAEVSLFPVTRKLTTVSAPADIHPVTRDSDSQIHLAIVVNKSREIILAERTKRKLLAAYRSREVFCESLAKLTQFRDRETGQHLCRTKAYVKLLLRNVPGENVFGEYGIRVLTRASTLHDIGKVGIPDAILLKAGSLSQEERSIIQTHTTLGALTIGKMINVGSDDPALVYAMEIAHFHHERWDGTGYPYRLSRDQTPLVARIMAISDVYDALRSQRPYKKPMSHTEAINILRSGAGTQFDPELIRVFDTLEQEFARIADTEERLLQEQDEEDSTPYS